MLEMSGCGSIIHGGVVGLLLLLLLLLHFGSTFPKSPIIRAITFSTTTASKSTHMHTYLHTTYMGRRPHEISMQTAHVLSKP